MSRGLGVDVLKGNTLHTRYKKVNKSLSNKCQQITSSAHSWKEICFIYLVILMDEGSRDFLPKDLPENGIPSFSSHLALVRG